jgi:uncharacterized membrane protein
MGQDNNSDNSYGTGYGGYGHYSGPSQPSDASSYAGQEYGHYGQPGQTGGSQQQQAPGQQGQQWQQQTYSSATYEPPASVQGTSPFDPTSTGLQAKTEALISYLFGWFSGIIFLLIERKNRFVRFSAAQSTIFFGIVTVLYILLRFISVIPILGFLLSPVIGFITFVGGIVVFLIWLFLMIQAYRGKTVRLPFISGYADNLVQLLTPKRKKTV